jgi:predicted Zn-dependent protease
MPIELPPGTAAYSNSTPPPDNKQLLVVLGLFIGAIAFVIAVALWSAGALVWLIPQSAEQQLGRVIVPVYEKQSKPSPTQDTLNTLLDRLEAQLPTKQREGRDYQVLYVPEDTVNALALPGDRIVIFKGLLAEAESENELAMVLGHELGHFANRDHLRGLTRQVMLSLVLSSMFGDVGSIGAIASNSIYAISNAQFSQSQEKQADEVGLKLLEQTYGHAAGATDFFRRSVEQDIPGMSILASHPPSKSRIDHIEKLIEQQDYLVKEKTDLPKELKL